MFEELCTSRLLVMEWIDGCKLSDGQCLRRRGINPRSVALTLVDAFSEMTLIHGFIHGDPHPGNLLVIPIPYVPSISLFDIQPIHPFSFEKRQHWLWRFLSFQWRTPFQLVLLDHGHYLEIDHDTRRDYCELWCSLVQGDQRSAIEAATRMCHDASGGRLLPNVLYRPFDQRTRRNLRSSMSMADVVHLLKSAPQTLVDALRIVAVVRHVATALADIKADRPYIEAMHAWNGLLLEDKMEANFRIAWRVEFRVKLHLWIMRLAMWLRDISYSWELFRDV